MKELTEEVILKTDVSSAEGFAFVPIEKIDLLKLCSLSVYETNTTEVKLRCMSLTSVTEECIEDFNLYNDKLYLSYMELSPVMNSSYIEVLTIQYCLDHFEGFYLNDVFDNNSMYEEPFGGTILNTVNYINLAIRDSKVLSLGEVLKGVL